MNAGVPSSHCARSRSCADDCSSIGADPGTGDSDVGRTNASANDGAAAGAGSSDRYADDRGSVCRITGRDTECADADKVADGRVYDAGVNAVADAVVGLREGYGDTDIGGVVGRGGD